jgi:nucleoside 2-deoxyribosyltransferase
MWFAAEMSPAYHEGIKPAIEEDAGFRSIRVDDVEHTGKIDDRIIAEIRESRFVVADFTGQRGGVYFEAGFAAGLGLPVVWLCRQDQIGNVHFDTRQYNHIVWAEVSELRAKLANRIRATVGLGPNQRPKR